MSDFSEQMEALRAKMLRRHLETKAKFELLRAEMKSDTRQLRRDMELAFERSEMRTDARMDGLAAIFQSEVDSVDDALQIISGLVVSQQAKQSVFEEEHRGRFEELEHWFQQVSDHEARLTRIEERQNPAA